jgi:hypothetical protein
MRRMVVVGGLVALSLALGGAAWAQSKCDARVTTALARKVRCKLKTYAAAQEHGSAVNTSRLSGCEATFEGKCGKAQAKGGCQAQAASCAELEITADAAVDALRGTPTQTASRCDSAVTRAVGKKVGCKLRVHAAAQEVGGPVNPAKLTKCEGNFTAACGKAQSKGDCQAQTSSCAALEATADAAIDVLSGATTSTTTIPTTTTSSTTTTTTTSTTTTSTTTSTTTTSTTTTTTSTMICGVRGGAPGPGNNQYAAMFDTTREACQAACDANASCRCIVWADVSHICSLHTAACSAFLTSGRALLYYQQFCP